MGKKKRIKIDWEMPEFFYSEDEDLIRYKSRFEYLRNGSGLLRLIPWLYPSGRAYLAIMSELELKEQEKQSGYGNVEQKEYNFEI